MRAYQVHNRAMLQGRWPTGSRSSRLRTLDGEVDLILLAIGFAAMIPLVIFVAALLTSPLVRLVCTGAGLLVYLAVEMLFADVFLHEYLEPYESFELALADISIVALLELAWLWARQTGKTSRSPVTYGSSPGRAL